jgi:hypothetical protein
MKRITFILTTCKDASREENGAWPEGTFTGRAAEYRSKRADAAHSFGWADRNGVNPGRCCPGFRQCSSSALLCARTYRFHVEV